MSDGEDIRPDDLPETPAVPPSKVPDATNPPFDTGEPPVIVVTDPPEGQKNTAASSTQQPAGLDPDQSESKSPETLPPGTTPTETLIPVIGEETAPPQLTTPPPEDTIPPPGPDTTIGPSGDWGYFGRNYVKYPIFSKAFPTRRLNLPGSPSAWAEVPGVCNIEGADLLMLCKLVFKIE